MRVLVAGATGFMGRHLVQRLLRRGDNVRALVRETSDWAALQRSGAEIVFGGAGETQRLSEACRETDIVYNLIGQLGGWGVPQSRMRAANVAAVRELLECCRETNVSQIVHCSTPGVVGMRGVAPESLPCRPAGYYEMTKYEGEKLVLEWQGNSRTAVTVVRPDFVYGPGDLHKLKLFKAVKNGRFALIGEGKSLLHPSYIDDIVDGLLLVSGNTAAYGEVFNMAGPEPVPVSRLVSAIARILGVPIPRKTVPLQLARPCAAMSELIALMTGVAPMITRYQVKFFSRDHASDISKARKVLGYEPKVSLEDGLSRTIEWYRAEALL